MPRPSNPELTVAWKIYIPATLAGRIEHLFWDPGLNKPKHGARNKLIVDLLEAFIAGRAAAILPPPEGEKKDA